MSVFPTRALSSVCDISMGQAPKGDSYNDMRRGYPLIAGAGDFGELTPSPKQYTDAPTKLSKPGDLILCIRATIGDRNWSDTEYCLGRGVAGLRAKDGALLQTYLGYWLDHAAPVLRARGRGATFLQVSKVDIGSLQIPLPRLAEQKRIAGILDAADAVRVKRREALAQLDTLLQSTFLDMFGDPVTNPMGWPQTSLSAISEELRDGPFGSNLKSSHYVESGVRVLRLQNIGVGEILNDDLAYISEAHFASLPRNHCGPGDVIIGTMGDPNLRACVVPPTLTRALNKADCILMRVDVAKADPIYICWLLNNPRMVSMALRLVRGQTRGRISLGRLKELQINLPPMKQQIRFAALVISVEQQKASQRTHLTELDTLFASLQSRAFRGDL